jgi:integrase
MTGDDAIRIYNERIQGRVDLKPLTKDLSQPADWRLAEIMVRFGKGGYHDLRHLFATRCIESGVDIPTVSR